LRARPGLSEAVLVNALDPAITFVTSVLAAASKRIAPRPAEPANAIER
jgi:hypothetical protein